MPVAITQDLFKRHDPIEFDEAKVAELRKKHDLVPYWANQRARDTRRGWGTLDPIEVADPRFEDVFACLLNKPRNPKRQTRNGYYHQGDSVLAVQSGEDYDISQARRDYLANRRIRNMRDGNPVEAELRGANRNIETYTPFLRHTDDKGRDKVGSTPGAPVRGFVKMPGPEREPVVTFQDLAPKTEDKPRRGRPKRSKS
jgi:hypothetical protein